MAAARPRPPRLGLCLLRLRRLGDRREEIEADLLEQFERRLVKRGHRHASWRYVRDVVSVSRPPLAPRPGSRRPVHLRIEDRWRDVAFAIRLIRHRPGLILLTIAGLGLAIGVSTATFGLVMATAFRSNGVSDPGSVVSVQGFDLQGRARGWTYDEFHALRDRSSTAVLETAMYESVGFGQRTEAGYQQRVAVHAASGGYLSTFGATPVIGRLLTAADEHPAAAPAAVASEGFWTRRLNQDPTVVGRTVSLDGIQVAIVGIVRGPFSGPAVDVPGLWVSSTTALSLFPYASDVPNWRINGRLRPGVGPAAAEAELSALAGAVKAERAGAGNPGRARVRLDPIRTVRGDVTAIGTTVVVALALVLLIASANMANLLLANASERDREIGMRLALGAGRRRVAAQLLTEGLVFGVFGATAGLAASLWLGPAFAELLGIPAGIDVTFDWRVYAFLVASTMLVGGLAALAPVRYALRGDLASPLKGATSAGGPARRRARVILIAVQAAASIVLLIATSVLSKSVIGASTVDLGFDVDRVLAVSPRHPYQTCDDACAGEYLRTATERLRAQPDVEAVAVTSNPPLIGSWFPVAVNQDGRQHVFARTRASADYITTMGLRVVRGRSYSEAEVAASAPVAVVTEQLARTLWPSGDPLGARLDPLGDDFAGMRVVGVATDSVSSLVPTIRRDGLFVPLGERTAATLIVRTRGDAEAAVPRVHAAIAALDPRVRVVTVAMRNAVAEELRPVRAVVAVSSTVTAVALGLALLGLYGVTAIVVGQRTQEIGVRMALGATGRDVARLLARDSLKPVLVGLVAGMAVAVVVARLFMSLILGVSPTDPASLAAAAGVLVLAALAAIVAPARRAARVDPATVLRQL